MSQLTAIVSYTLSLQQKIIKYMTHEQSPMGILTYNGQTPHNYVWFNQPLLLHVRAHCDITSDIESNGHLSLTLDSAIKWER